MEHASAYASITNLSSKSGGRGATKRQVAHTMKASEVEANPGSGLDTCPASTFG